MTAGKVQFLWRYPVKSMRGEQITTVQVSERGLEGDRALALIDRETGKVASIKHPRLWGRLLTCGAFVHSITSHEQLPTVRISLPDGRQFLSSDQNADAMLSDFIARPVKLADVAPEGAETEREYPEVDGLPVSGAFFSAPIAGGAPHGTFFDFAPVHLVTTATLAALSKVNPGTSFDSRRFRPNLVIATPDGVEGFVENEWVGRTLHVGAEVRLRVTDPTPRCVVTTLPQSDLPRDVGILRTIAAHNRPPIPTLGGVTWPSVGVYAVVERGGTLRQGDSVRLMATP